MTNKHYSTDKPRHYLLLQSNTGFGKELSSGKSHPHGQSSTKYSLRFSVYLYVMMGKNDDKVLSHLLVSLIKGKLQLKLCLRLAT
jgi:hypothetical protein